MEEEAELFSTQLLGMLPNLEYIAKISGEDSQGTATYLDILMAKYECE